MIKGKRKRQNRYSAGTTLVEMLVALMLISIMMVMAAGGLSSASRIFVETQQTQYAQSILDTTMTELQSITENVTGYIKIYAKKDNEIANKGGSAEGNALEFINEDQYVELVTTDGCEKTALYVQGQQKGTADAVPSGQLLTRYYARDTSKGDRTYYYSMGTILAARAVAPVYGSKFYMGNYLEVIYSLPEGTKQGDVVPGITATLTLYKDAACTQPVATDTETLEFRHEVKCEYGITGTYSGTE